MKSPLFGFHPFNSLGVAFKDTESSLPSGLHDWRMCLALPTSLPVHREEGFHGFLGIYPKQLQGLVVGIFELSEFLVIERLRLLRSFSGIRALRMRALAVVVFL